MSDWRQLLKISITPRRQPYCLAIERRQGRWWLILWLQGRQEKWTYRQIPLSRRKDDGANTGERGAA